MTINLVPTRSTRAVVADMIRAAETTPAADVVLDRFTDLCPDQYAAALVLVLSVKAQPRTTPVPRRQQLKRARKFADPQTSRIATEEAMFDDDQARRARAAYARGERSDWAVIGSRVYFRRIRAARLARGQQHETQEVA